MASSAAATRKRTDDSNSGLLQTPGGGDRIAGTAVPGQRSKAAAGGPSLLAHARLLALMPQVVQLPDNDSSGRWPARFVLRIQVGLLLLALLALSLTATGGERSVLTVETLAPPQPLAMADELIAGQHADDFLRLAPTDIYELRGNGVGHWLRVTPAQPWQHEREPVLAIRHRPGTQVTVYAPPLYQPVERSLFRPEPNAEFSSDAPAFRLPMNFGPATPVYLHLDTPARTRLQLSVEDIASYRHHDMRHAQYLAAIHVGLLVMVLVVFCYWLILREPLFLHYIGYIGSLLMFSLLLTGQGYLLPGIALLADWGLHGLWFFFALSASFVCSFAQRFMELPRYTPRLSRAISVARWLFLAMALSLLLPWQHTQIWLRQVGNPAILMINPLLLVAAVLALKQGNRYARFYLIGWLPLTILTFLFSAQASGYIQDMNRILTAYQLAAVFEAVVLSMGLAYRALSFRRERDSARLMAEYDGLTGAFNRRGLMAQLRVAFADAEHGRPSLSAIFLDLDHFKQVNDRLGHLTGDECLKAVATEIQLHLRQGDCLGRYGGEEFLILLPGADRLDAARIAERIRRGVERRSMADHGGQPVRLTVSIGVASYSSKLRNPDELIAQADAAMYRAKHSGRNQVVLADGDGGYAPPTAVSALVASATNP